MNTWTIEVIDPQKVEGIDLKMEDNDFTLIENVADNILNAEEYSEAQQTTSPFNKEIVKEEGTEEQEETEEHFVCPKCNKLYDVEENNWKVQIIKESGQASRNTCIFCTYNKHRRNEVLKHMKEFFSRN